MLKVTSEKPEGIAMTIDTGMFMTRHAVQRTAQRGIRPDVWDIFIGYADIEAPTGAGCRLIRLSAKTARQLVDFGLSQVLVARACRIQAIISADGLVVTAMIVPSDRRLPKTPSSARVRIARLRGRRA
jgi:hypothetical protein